MCSKVLNLKMFRRLAASTALLVAGAAHAAGEFDVKTHRAWQGYAIPNGIWLSGDYTGDRRDDLLHVVAGTDYVHTWRSTGGGRFAIGTFRPWRNYAMPNGVWVNADLNGDRKMDVVHVVAGTDYVHPWLSRGNGTFDVKTFRPWRGYAMPNGIWLVADLNGDRRDDLVHVVDRTDYVHTWLSNGNGTFRVGTFRPWNGYAMPNGIWRVGDFNGDGRDDLVHAVRGTDYVHTWLSRGNGTFNVGTFRPWRGYAIPNGEWHVGDFNGDNNDDILHVVNRTDYVHTWLSRGNGTFNVGTFRPWSGYAMPNGIWRVTDLDRDGKDDVVHAVRNTSYAHVWRSTTAHRFAVTTFSPWRGYAIPNGLWLTGDYDGDRKGDVLHVVNRTNYVHPWLSRMPAPGEMAVSGVELPQTVQDMDHTVPMIAGKATMARVYLDLNATAPRAVRGRLTARNLTTNRTQVVASLNAVAVDPAQNGNLQPKREDVSLGLNFRVPPRVLGAGRLDVRLSGLTDASSGAAVPCSNCGPQVRTVNLVDSAPMRVRVLGMRYRQNNTNFAPRAVDFNLIRSWLRRVYPTATVNMSQITVNANATAPFGCGDINTQLAAIRATEVGNNSVDARTHYYGVVSDGGFFMRGCAAGIPGSPRPQTVSSGPTGPGNWGWDNDGSYGDWYAGHELGHTYGRHHIGSGCGDSASDPNYPYPSGQISPNDGRFVGFDVGDPGNGIPMRALPGTDWTDVMSYCRNQWMSDYTYRAIQARLNGENALPGGLVPVAGVATAAPVEEPVEPASAGPSPVVEGEGPLPVFVGGERPGEFIGPAYAPPGEIAPEMPTAPSLDVPAAYDGPPDVEVEGEDPFALTEAAGPVPPGLEAAVPEGLEEMEAPVLPQPTGPLAVAGDYLSVTGTVNLTGNTGDLRYVTPVSQGQAAAGAPDETAVVRVLDGNGQEMARHNVFVLLDSEREPGEDVKGIVDALIPRVTGAATLALEVNGVEVDRFAIAAAVGGVALEAMTGPVDIEATLSEDGSEIAVAAPRAGPAAEGATYSVEISTDDGETWQVVAIGQSTPETTIDLTPIEEARGISVRVLVNTGLAVEVLGEASVSRP